MSWPMRAHASLCIVVCSTLGAVVLFRLLIPAVYFGGFIEFWDNLNKVASNLVAKCMYPFNYALPILQMLFDLNLVI